MDTMQFTNAEGKTLEQHKTEEQASHDAEQARLENEGVEAMKVQAFAYETLDTSETHKLQFVLVQLGGRRALESIAAGCLERGQPMQRFNHTLVHGVRLQGANKVIHRAAQAIPEYPANPHQGGRWLMDMVLYAGPAPLVRSLARLAGRLAALAQWRKDTEEQKYWSNVATVCDQVLPELVVEMSVNLQGA